jgi:hypothetical protein
MNLGTILVLIGTILAAIDFFTVDYRLGGRSLLAAGVILIGAGVLVGATPLT